VKAIVLFCLVMNFALVVHAKISLNSQCYMIDNGGDFKVIGDDTQRLFEIASVSKVVTAYWALRELGPQFRFGTQVYIMPVARDLFDVHIQGSKDPFWGRQLTHFLFAELNKYGVYNIRNLTFDENLGFRWQVVSDFIEPQYPSADEIAQALDRRIRALAGEYPRTRQEAASLGLSMPKSLAIRAEKVEFQSSSNFRPPSDAKKFVLKSAPLYRYLKEMNIVSNNHVADKLFEILGGVNRFELFLKNTLGMTSSDVAFINGSGNSVVTSGGKVYNQATCEAIVRIQYKMQKDLRSQYQMGLKDVMAVSGADGGTLSPRYDAIPNSLTAKTGTVDPAVALSGVLSTQQGEVYFGIFLATTSPSDWVPARNQVRSKVMNLLQTFGGRKAFSYTARAFLPFDSKSGFAMTSPQQVQQFNNVMP